MATVSVIVPTFNREKKVVQAVSSILNQSYKDYEVIVVDDGSSDCTKDALRPFFDQIHYTAHTSNLGVSAARNTGIRLASAPYIAFLDSDDTWLPEKLAIQMAHLSRNPEVAVCQTEEVWIRNAHIVNPRKKHQKTSGDIFAASLKLCLVSPSAVVIKKSIFNEVGLFDETLPACEDYDLWLRISCRYPVDLIKERLVIKHGGHFDQLSQRYKGMDRFRIQALIKLIRNGNLSDEQQEAAMRALSDKCHIYGKGCLKRGKIKEGTLYLNLPQKLTEEMALGSINPHRS